MHYMLKLLLFVGAAAAFGPSSASAALEAKQENLFHCPATSFPGGGGVTDVDGGCLTHITGAGAVEVRKHVFGIESHITTCNKEFAARFDENMNGYIFEQVLSGAGCARQACATDNHHGEKIPWPTSAFEAPSGQGITEGREYMTLTLCVEPREGGADEICEIDIPFQTYSNQHRQEYGHATELSSHGGSPFRCEIVGHWIGENGGTHDGQTEQELVVSHT